MAGPTPLPSTTHTNILTIDAASWDAYKTAGVPSPIDGEIEMGGWTIEDIVHNCQEGTVWRYTEEWTHVEGLKDLEILIEDVLKLLSPKPPKTPPEAK